MKTTKIRFTIYVLLLALFLGITLLKINAHKHLVNAPKNTFYKLSLENGQPVTAETVLLEDFSLTQKITANKTGTHKLTSYVSGEAKKQLKPSQLFYSEDKLIKGRIHSIDKKISLENGLFKIELTSDEPLNLGDNKSIPLLIEIKKFTQVNTLSTESIFNEDGKTYIWKISNHRAKKIPISLSFNSGNKLIVKKGVSPGDMVVKTGHQTLDNNQKVIIIETQTGKSL